MPGILISPVKTYAYQFINKEVVNDELGTICHRDDNSAVIRTIRVAISPFPIQSEVRDKYFTILVAFSLALMKLHDDRPASMRHKDGWHLVPQ